MVEMETVSVMLEFKDFKTLKTDVQRLLRRADSLSTVIVCNNGRLFTIRSHRLEQEDDPIWSIGSSGIVEYPDFPPSFLQAVHLPKFGGREHNTWRFSMLGETRKRIIADETNLYLFFASQGGVAGAAIFGDSDLQKKCIQEYEESKTSDPRTLAEIIKSRQWLDPFEIQE